MSRSVFEQLVTVSGLSGVFASTALRRVCERAKIPPERLTTADVARLLQDIERTLLIYLSRPDTEASMKRIRDLATK